MQNAIAPLQVSSVKNAAFYINALIWKHIIFEKSTKFEAAFDKISSHNHSIWYNQLSHEHSNQMMSEIFDTDQQSQ